MISRIERLREAMEGAGESFFLVTEPKNRRYLSGFTGSAGWLLVTSKKAFLLTDGRYWDQVERQCHGLELFRYTPSEHSGLSAALSRLMTEQIGFGKGTVGAVEIDDMPISTYRDIGKALTEAGFSVLDVEGRVKGFRATKDEHELELLRQAAKIADEALSSALQLFEVGMTEQALKAEIDYQVLRRGGEGAAFPTIVASGCNGSFPHAGASDKEIQAGELVTIDFGAIWKGYCSDMTRTVWLGQLSDQDRVLFDEVTKAQAKAVAAARPGIASGGLDEVARASLREAGLSEFFVHSLGHGVGLDVHEAPTLRAGQTDLLSQGQVITIEPGVYLPGRTGCRVEDTVVLRSDGCEVLNKYPKQLLQQTSPPLLVS